MSEGMHPWLAQCYRTPGAPTEEDLQKVAEAELFAKVALEQGFDVNQMTDEEVADLWNKTAGEIPPQFVNKKEKGEGEEKKDEKKEEEKEEKEAAAAEWAMQKAATDQVQFMDYCGRVMAHAYVNELTKIGEAMAKDGEKTAGENPLLSNLSQGGAAAGTAAAPEDVNDRIQKLASAAPGTAATQPASSEKIDQLAAREAVKLATDAGIDKDLAASRVQALLTLGAQESTKIASVGTIDEAIQVRGLELLEQAGFEVNWNE